MRSSKIKQTKIEKLLINAYNQRDDDIILSEKWHRSVMDDIKHGNSPDLQQNIVPLINQWSGRLIPALSISIVCACFILLSLDFNPEYEIAKVFLNDPLEFFIDQMWGI